MEFRALLQEMRTAMQAAGGIGLAAPQIGISLKLAVIEFDPHADPHHEHEPDEPQIPFFVIANPTITQHNREVEVYEEGCLSVPGLSTPVPRWTAVTVLAANERGERIRLRAQGLLARILQHEIDHVAGILIVDRTTDKQVRRQYAH